MHETLCFSIQSLSPNLDDLPLRCDGCETVSCVVGSWADQIMFGSCSDHARIGSALYGVSPFSCMCGRQNSSATVGSSRNELQVVLVDELPMEFHCECNCIVPAMQMALQVVLVEELPMEF